MSNPLQPPLVSVIITNYNYSSYISQAIESVLNQSYQNFELIVVDDGSTDDSRKIIESYGEQIIPIFQKNFGQSAAVNTGIEKSVGDIVCLLDADDIFELTKLQHIVDAFDANPDWVQIVHSYTAVDEQGIPLSRSHKTLSSGDVTPLLMRWGRYGWVSTSGLSFRRESLQKVLPVPSLSKEEVKGGIDTYMTPIDSYLTATVPFFGKVGAIDVPLMQYRLHGKNYTGKVNLKMLIQDREFVAGEINAIATNLGRTDRFHLKNDADYRLFKTLESGRRTLGSSVEIIWLNLIENISVGRSFRDSAMRLLQKMLCLMFIEEGREILYSGVKAYVKSKVVRRTQSAV